MLGTQIIASLSFVGGKNGAKHADSVELFKVRSNTRMVTTWASQRGPFHVTLWSISLTAKSR